MAKVSKLIRRKDTYKGIYIHICVCVHSAKGPDHSLHVKKREREREGSKKAECQYGVPTLPNFVCLLSLLLLPIANLEISAVHFFSQVKT